MTLGRPIIYTQSRGITELKSEEQVLEVLNDVKRDIARFEADFLKVSLGHVLNVVELGRYIIPGGRTSDVIDLTSVQGMFMRWRNLSEKEGRSCEHFELADGDFPGARASYCSKHENQLAADFRRGESHRTMDCVKKACGDCEYVHRKLDDVLEGK